MKEKKPHRSDRYQYKICERSVSDLFLNSFSDDQGNICLLKEKEILELQTLNDNLETLMINVLKESMTPKQMQILQLWSEGCTQMEISKKLGVNQSSVTKSLHGNIDYKNVGKKRYGGASKKGFKIIKASESLKPLCLQIYQNDLTEHFRLFAYQTIKNVFKNETDFEIWLGIRPPPVNNLLSEQSIKICAEHLEGRTLKSLSEKYKISYKKIRAIVKGCP